MEVLKYKKENVYDIPDILTDIFNDSKFAIFDIETTGLNPSYNKVILIGMLYMENNEIFIEQFFCNTSKDEKELLNSFKDKFSRFDYYITFNGTTFDIPFLNKRFAKNNIDFKLDSYLNLDIYKIIRKDKKNLNLPNCKLKTVENFLGIQRTDTINGSESVRLYKEYELTQDSTLKDKILLHNFEDILHLIPTLKILNYIDKNAIVTNMPKQFAINNKLKIKIVDYSIEGDFLNIKGKYSGNLKKDYIFYNANYSLELKKSEKSFKLKIPLLNLNINNKSYVYINIDELKYQNFSLSNMNTSERNKYLIKKQNHINHENIYDFIKNYTIYTLKEIDL